MATREKTKQSDHDNAVYAAKEIYENKGKNVWINPGSEKNKKWSGRYIDVIATVDKNSTKAWVTEIETDDSVSSSEAEDQWKDYDKAYTNWHLAVPVDLKKEAQQLLNKNNIKNCTVITWKKNDNGIHTFWGLPGLD